jgi:D-alanyl-D-alanine carboxypeptidase
MFRRAQGAAAAVAVALAACSPAASPPAAAKTGCGAPFSPRIEHELENVAVVARRAYQVPGIAVAAVVPGEGCWVSASGLASTAPRVPLRLSDEFPIASITKTFTATVILQLVQQGKLSLSAPIGRWVPYVQHARRITIGMLLNMTSGIYDQPMVGNNPGQVFTPQQVVHFAVAHGPQGPPGRFYYSNTNYIILGMIAQAVTGEPIQELITRQILRPLHLTHTSFPTAAAPPHLRVQGYTVIQEAAYPTTGYDSPANLSLVGAAGAMISTVGDLQVWARALATGALLSPAVQRQRLRLGAVFGAFPPLRGPASAALPVRYGLGIFSLGGLLGHNGGTSGYTADMFYLPARRATIIVLANAQNLQFQATREGETVSGAATVSIARTMLPGALTAPG